MAGKLPTLSSTLEPVNDMQSDSLQYVMTFKEEGSEIQSFCTMLEILDGFAVVELDSVRAILTICCRNE